MGKGAAQQKFVEIYCVPTSEPGTENWERNPVYEVSPRVLTVCWGKTNTQLQYTKGELRNKTVN